VIDFCVRFLCCVHQEVTHVQSYKTRLNCELMQWCRINWFFETNYIEFNKECSGKLGIQMSVFMFCQGMTSCKLILSSRSRVTLAGKVICWDLTPGVSDSRTVPRGSKVELMILFRNWPALWTPSHTKYTNWILAFRSAVKKCLSKTVPSVNQRLCIHLSRI